MKDEFLHALLKDPGDDVTRLVYADWLEERGDEASLTQAEFLRLEVNFATERVTRGKRNARRNRLHVLAARLETRWLRIVIRQRAASCRRNERQSLTFDFRTRPIAAASK